MTKTTRYFAICATTPAGEKLYGALPAPAKDSAIEDGRTEYDIPPHEMVDAYEVCGGCVDGGLNPDECGSPEYRYSGLMLCDECLDGYREMEDGERDYGYDDGDGYYGRTMFADPGGNSALRAASEDNPRNLPCPNCGGEDLLTPADRARGYQCDRCADRCERGLDY